MRAVRRKTAEHLTAAWLNIPHVTQHDSPTSPASRSCGRATRSRSKRRRQPDGHRGGGEDRRGRAQGFPQFNSSIDMAASEIDPKKYVQHRRRGRYRPRAAGAGHPRRRQEEPDRRSPVELAQLSEKARTRKISLDEMQGGCFSISNLGGIGGSVFTPIVNSPEVAILGISRGAHASRCTTRRPASSCRA